MSQMSVIQLFVLLALNGLLINIKATNVPLGVAD